MTDVTDTPDYRTNLQGNTVEQSERWVRVRLGQETIADSRQPMLLIQYGARALPTYMFHSEEVRLDRLVDPVERDGRIYWTVHVNGRTVKEGAWTYLEPPDGLEELQNLITFDWEALAWFEEEERVFVHARDPHKRVDAIRSARHVEVSVAGKVIAESHRPTLLFETWLPTRYYLPPDDVDHASLRESSLVSQCPYKGVARYWSVVVGEQVFENLVWSYPDPILENPKIKGLMCFFNERVDIRVDSEKQPRPLTPWS